MRRFPVAEQQVPATPTVAPGNDTADALRDLVAAMKANLNGAPQVIVAPPDVKQWNTLTVSIVRDRKGDFEKLIFTKG